MKKVSVTDRYTYDGKEMSEREVEIYKDGKTEQLPLWAFLLLFFGFFMIGFILGFFYKTNH